jgi:hypothetical protein
MYVAYHKSSMGNVYRQALSMMDSSHAALFATSSGSNNIDNTAIVSPLTTTIFGNQA